MHHRYTFTKEERLCNKVILEQLFSEGISIFSFPFKILLIQQTLDTQSTVKVVFSVPKRNFKQAVKRNLIRRRMRESYRLNKTILTNNCIPGTQLSVMFIYIDKSVQEYKVIEKGIIKSMEKIIKQLHL